jgi:hypothetical protein
MKTSIFLFIAFLIFNISISKAQKYYIVIPSDISTYNYSNQIESILATISPKVKIKNKIVIIRADLKDQKKIRYNYNKLNKIYKYKIFNIKSILSIDNSNDIYPYIDDLAYRKYIKIDNLTYKAIYYSTNKFSANYKTKDNLKREFEKIYLSLLDRKNSVIFFYIDYEISKTINSPAIVYPQEDYQAIPYDDEIKDYKAIHICWESMPQASAYIMKIYITDTFGRTSNKFFPDKIIHLKDNSLNLKECSSQICDYTLKAGNFENNGLYKIMISAVSGEKESKVSERIFMFWDCNYKLNWKVTNCSYEIQKK